MDKKSRYLRLSQLSEKPLPALTVRYARHFLNDYPDHGGAWMLLAIALGDLARYDEAEEAFHKTLNLCKPGTRQIVLGQMGHRYCQSGNFRQAAVWYRKAIDADPDDATYHIFLGSVLAQQGRLRVAGPSRPRQPPDDRYSLPRKNAVSPTPGSALTNHARNTTD